MHNFHQDVFSRHERTFDKNRYVYPVISRRSEGLSLGINLSLRKECNFDCVYCQVDRTEKEDREKHIDLLVLKEELIELIEGALNGSLFSHPRFHGALEQYKQLKDIALSGDGEPTTGKYFSPVAELVLDTIHTYQKKDIFIKPIVITNGTTLNRPYIQELLQRFYQSGGVAWIKLDAGTPEEFRKIAETSISFSTIIDNILNFSKLQPVTLQTIVYKNLAELSLSIDKYTECLLNMQKNGASFLQIQLYTLARNTRVSTLYPVLESELLHIADEIRTKTGIQVKIYP